MVVKNQHYIPQFYLRAFSNSGKKSKREIWQYSKIKNEKKLELVKKTGSKDFFYELPKYLQQAYIQKFGEDDNFNLIENTLDSYEGVFSKHYYDLVAEIEKLNDLSEYLMNNSNRLWISFFIIVQFYRTQKWRELKKREYMKESKKIGKPIGNIIEDWKLHKFREDVASNKSLLDQQLYFIDRNGLEELNPEVNNIANYLWCIGENMSVIPFITSDCPVVKFSNIKINEINFNGILFPLTERFILIIVETDILNPELVNISNKLIQIFEKEVRYMNSLQLNESFEFVYSSNEDLETLM